MVKKVFILVALFCSVPTYAVNCLNPADFIQHNTRWELSDKARQDWYIYQQNNSSGSTSLIRAHLSVEINNSSPASYLTCRYLLADNTSLLVKPVNPRKAKGGNTFLKGTFSQFEPLTTLLTWVPLPSYPWVMILGAVFDLDRGRGSIEYPTITFYSCESAADQPENCSWEWE